MQNHRCVYHASECTEHIHTTLVWGGGGVNISCSECVHAMYEYVDAMEGGHASVQLNLLVAMIKFICIHIYIYGATELAVRRGCVRTWMAHMFAL